MSRLLENILSKNQKINFDFSKSFNRQNQILDFVRDNQLPVHPKESSWETIVDHQGRYGDTIRYTTQGYAKDPHGT